MMRVRTLFARSARAAAEYYGKYLAKDAHEIPGRWTGRQAPELGLIGHVSVDDLSDVLAGLDHLTIVKPTSTSAAPHRRFYTDYALCVRPFVRNLSGIDIGATEPGRRLLAWYSELRDRIEQDGSDGLDRIAW